MSKEMRLFQSGLSGRCYATQDYTEHDDGLVEVTGRKYDVTADLKAILERVWNEGHEAGQAYVGQGSPAPENPYKEKEAASEGA